jgi:hypothetical protein
VRIGIKGFEDIKINHTMLKHNTEIM